MSVDLSPLLFLFILTLASLAAAPHCAAQTPPTTLARAAWRVRQIVGHRGSSADRPENTLASFERAIAAGATAVEVDVRRSKDGALILRHDDELGRTTNSTGLVREKTLAELRKLDAGAWFGPQFAGERIPTLTEALVLCRGRCDILLDLKEQGADYSQQIAAEVREHGEEPRTILGVRSVEQAALFRKLLPRAKQIGLIGKQDEIEAYAQVGVETIRLWPRWLTDATLVPRVRKAKAMLHLGAEKGTLEELAPLLEHQPESLSADDPALLLKSLTELARTFPAGRATPAGTLPLSGLKAPVEVVRDAWGVPHIYAQNQDDLFFAQGFVVAQDRLFQVDMWRRQALGELAEVLGPSALPADRFARRTKYRGDMAAEWRSYAPDAQAIATAFTRGINAGIDAFGDNLPLEFQLLQYKPKKWAPEDILGRSSGVYMSQNFRNEVARLLLIKEVGLEKARWLAPIEPEADYALNLSDDDIKAFPADLLAEYTALTKSLSFTPPPTESNNWVLSGQRSQSGKPLLASDPHRAIALPSLRYMVHLHAPGWNVIGAGEPGLPGVAIGHNERIAWGFTIIGADQADLFVETLNPQNPEEYAVGERFEPFQTWTEEIAVRGQDQPTRLVVKHSRHGPILREDAANGRAYALRWSGNEPGGAAYLASLRVDRATNREEFRQALAHWKVPGLNFVYADVNGDYGWIAAAAYPERGGHYGLLPVPGRGGFDWTGFRQLDDYPQAFRQPSGVAITANHNILPPGYRPHVGNEFSAPYRFQRLDQLLAAKPKWELAEFKPLQQDHFSLPAAELVKILREVGPAESEREAAKLLTDWDGDLTVDAPAGPLYVLWQKELREALFLRHVPRSLLPQMESLAGVRAVIAALQTSDVRWLGENAAEVRTQLIRQSLASAVQKWKRLPAAKQQRWGALHTVTFRHPLAVFGPVAEKLLNIGPIERPGDASTPNNTSYDEQFQQIHGASYRHLLDLADWDLGLATTAPGQSGEPSGAHYADQAAAWAKGEYFPLAYSRAKVDAVAKNRLTLEPKAE